MSNPFFLKIVGGKLIVWDYLSHNQFEVSDNHLSRILEISKGDNFKDTIIDNEIRESGIFGSEELSRWGWDMLSQIFHVGTQNVLPAGQDLPRNATFDGYVEFCSSIADRIPEIHIKRDGPVMPLPKYSGIKIRESVLENTLMQRYTCRCFDGSSMPLQNFADAMWLTFGAVHGDERSDLLEHDLMPVGYRRTSPSGGSMHASEPYVTVMNVDGLEPGIYHYRSETHELVHIGEKLADGDLGGLLCGQSFADNLSYGVFITSRFDKMWWKYPHSRAYRVCLLDIGCLVQTFQLVNTAMNIQSWPTGYFLDQNINKILKVDADLESVMFFVGAGYGSGSISREALDALARQAGKETRQ